MNTIPHRTVAVLVAAAIALPAAGRVVADIQPRPPSVGESAALMLVSDTAAPRIVDLPQVAGVTWLSTQPSVQQQMSLVNGRRSARYTASYRFDVARPGILRFPPLTVREGDTVRTVTVPPVKVTRNPYADLVHHSLSYDALDTPPEQLYQGQMLTLRLAVFVDGSVRVSQEVRSEDFYPTVALQNGALRDFADATRRNSTFVEQEPKRAVRNGREGIELGYVCMVSGIQQGSLSGTIRFTVPIIRSSGRHDPFHNLLRPLRNDRVSHRIEVSIPPIPVVPLPPPKTDDGLFLGLIGPWELQCDLSDSKVKAQEGVTLTLTANGVGNVESFSAPQFEPPGFTVFQPEQNISGVLESTIRVSWFLVPQRSDVVLPEMRFSTFDPELGAYRSHRFPLELEVLPGDPPPENLVVGATDTGETPTRAPRTQGPVDILFPKTALGAGLVLPLWRPRLPVLIGMTVAGPLFFLLALIWAARHERLAASPAFRRRRQALKRQPAVLRRIRQASPETLPEIIRSDLVPLLLDLHDLPPGTTVSELSRTLDDPELTAILNRAEVGAFMPGDTDAIDTALLLRKVRMLAALLGLLCAPMLAAATDNPMHQAAAAYETGEIDRAEAIYRHLADADDRLYPTLLYNLGNCAYRRNETGRALGYYERARRLAPRDSDILQNLNFIRAQLSLPPVDAAGGPLQRIALTRDQLRPDQWLSLAAGSWLLFWLLLGALRLRRMRFHPAAAAPLLLAVVALWAAAAQHRDTYRDGQCVVVESGVQMRLAPYDTGRPIGKPLRSGDYGLIREQRPNWSRVRIGQSEGWIRNHALFTIWP